MSENPLLANLRLPGRIFQLPSKGMFYKNGELSPGVKDGEIHVHPMSALDEINMKNPDQLFSGEAVKTVFKQCITGIDKPEDLLSKDVDAIMLFLRVVTYGPSYEFSAKHFCTDGKNHNYLADIDTLINNMTSVDPTMIQSMYTITLPNKQVVTLRPNRYDEVLNLIKANTNKTAITPKDQQTNLIMMLLGVIESVDGVTDRAHIEEWARHISSPLVARIAEKVEKINSWGPDLKWKCTCKDCGKDFEVEIPINPVSFFTE
jgi:hypothetical protein